MIQFSVVAQDYNTEAHNVYVIIGNAALLKCEIPSFVADFVSIISWTDDQGMEFFPSDQSMGTCNLTTINFAIELGTHKQTLYFTLKANHY